MKELIDLNQNFQTANDDQPPGNPRRLHALWVTGEHGAGKTHIFGNGRRIDDHSHSSGRKFTPVRTRPLDGIDDLSAAVEAMETTGEMIPLRAQPTGGLAFPERSGVLEMGDRLVTAAYRADDSDWKRCHEGRQWVMLDVDHLKSPDWFPEDPSPEDLHRGVEYARTQLPEPFQKARCYYQWSASAGIDDDGRMTWPKLKLHLWFWFDRPVLSYIADDKPLKKHTLKGYLERWNERVKNGDEEGTIIDPSTVGVVHKHYIAPPAFEGTDADGGPITDHLEGRRSGMLDGEQDSVEVPREIIPPDQFFELVDEYQQRKQRERQKRRQRIDAERLEVDEEQITDAARATLDQACEIIRSASEGSRHDTMIGRVHAVYAFVNAGELDDETAEERLVAAFVDVAGAERRGEAVRAIRGSRVEGHTIDPTRYTRRTYTPPEDLSPPDRRIDVESVDHARDILPEVVEEAHAEGGIHLISTPPGVGKSYSALGLAIETLADGGAVRYASYSHESLEEKREEIADRIDESDQIPDHKKGGLKAGISERPTRTDETCEKIEAYNMMRKKYPGAALDYCMSCELNPHTGEGGCLYWELREMHEGADMALSSLDVAGFDAMRAPERATEKKVVVDWSTIEKLIARGWPARIVLRSTPKTYRITAQRGADGEVFPAYPDDRSVDLTDANILTGEGVKITEPRSRSLSDDTRRRVTLRYLADRLECGPTRENIADRLIEMDRVESDCDLAILDESAVNFVKSPVEVTPKHIRQMRTAGEIDLSSDAERTLGDLLDESEESGQTINADDIAAKIEPDEIDVCPEGKYPAGAGVDDPEKAAKLRDWRAVDGLRGVLEADWQGAYISDGKLHLPFTREVPWHRLADTVLILDATATPDVARAVYGDDLQYTEIGLDAAATDVTHIPYSASSRKAPGGNFKRERAHDVWMTAHVMYDSPGTLHLTFKKYREEGSTADHVETLEGPVIHFGGEDAKGSNGYADCHTVVADAFYWHTGDVKQTAFALCQLAGDDWTDPDIRERWRWLARYEDETAKVIQALHRARPVLADDADPVRFIFLDKREPEIYGQEFSPDRKISPDKFVAEILRIHRNRDGATEYLKNFVDKSPDQTFIPALADRQKSPRSGANPQEHSLGACKGDDRQHNTIGDCHTCAPQDRIENFLRRHFNGSWRDFADASGLEHAQAKTSDGGKDRAIISREKISPARLRKILEGYDHDLSWIEHDGERIDLVGVESEMRSALAAIERSDFPDLSAREKQRLVGEKIGVSASAIRKCRMKTADWSTDDLADAWKEEHGVDQQTDASGVLAFISDDDPSDEYATPYSDPEPRSDYVRPYMTPLEFNGATREPFEREEDDPGREYEPPELTRQGPLSDLPGTPLMSVHLRAS